MKIDIGSGGFKREGFTGIDIVPSAGTDIVCDIERARWPLDDNMVSYAFSSHCFEHVNQANLVHIFRELTRVCEHGATVEIWNPYAFHRDAYVLGHVTYLTEEVYHHLCGLHDTWAPLLGARWHLREIRYHVPPDVLAPLQAAGISAEIAITHLNQIVKEFGVFIAIDKAASLEEAPYKRIIVDEYAHIPMRETRSLNPTLLSIGPATAPPSPALAARVFSRQLVANPTFEEAIQRAEAAEQALAAAQQEIAALRNSRTWRAMAPVRRLSGAARGLIPNV